jgi:hypothetical protein
MQTFLPYADFAASAAALDRQRLGKQRVEVLQLLKGSWPNHPASKMWRGHRLALVQYGLAVCAEWRRRGYADTCTTKIAAFIPPADMGLPSWLGDPAFHLSHRSNLVRKLPEHYGPMFPGVPANLPYVWPEVLR